RALHPNDRADVVVRRRSHFEVREAGADASVEHRRIVALELRRSRVVGGDDEAGALGDGTAGQDSCVTPRVEPGDRWRIGRPAGEQRWRGDTGIERARPGAAGTARLEGDGEAGGVGVERYQSGGDVDAIPGEHAWQKQRRSGAIRIGEVDRAEAEARLRP